MAISEKKLKYSEVFVHSVKVSLQEYQKKMKMFNNRQLDDEPAMEYVNIYEGSLPRLSLFKGITDEPLEDDDKYKTCGLMAEK